MACAACARCAGGIPASARAVAPSASNLLPFRHHIYINEGDVHYKSKADCWQFEEQARFDDSWLLSRNVSNPRYLYGTGYAQRALAEHQSNCDTSQGVLEWTSGSGNGLGFSIKLMNLLLSHAMDTGRIFQFAEHDSSNVFARGSHCKHQSWNCIFRKPTQCIWANRTNVQVVKGTMAFPFKRLWPRQFDTLLKCSPIKPSHYAVWWQAQAAAFLVKPSAALRDQMTGFRSKLRFSRGTTPRVYQHDQTAHADVSVHMRAGWKQREAKVFEFGDYAAAVDRLFDGVGVPVLPGSHAWQHAQSQSRRSLASSPCHVHIATENAAYLDAAHTQTNWSITHTKTIRTNQDRWLGGQGKAGVKEEVDMKEEVLNSLLNLELALEAEGWVVTLSSNWGSLIDALRSTVAGKADRPLWGIGISAALTRRGSTLS